MFARWSSITLVSAWSAPGSSGVRTIRASGAEWMGRSVILLMASPLSRTALACDERRVRSRQAGSTVATHRLNPKARLAEFFGDVRCFVQTLTRYFDRSPVELPHLPKADDPTG